VDIEVIKNYQREAYKNFSMQFDIPSVLKESLEKQLNSWERLCPGIWFESNSRSYFENGNLVQFMTYDDEEDGIFYLLAIWLKDSPCLKDGPIVVFSFTSHDDGTCSHTDTEVIAENMEKYFSLLATGFVVFGAPDLSEHCSFFSAIAKPFQNFEAARSYADKVSSIFYQSTELPEP
jgi:hypothetical protein